MEHAPQAHKLMQGASLIVLKRASVLMVERARAPSEGLWSFPAGRLEAGEDAETAARRELFEETGLTVGRLAVLGTFHPPGAIPPFQLTVFAARWQSGEPQAGDDARSAEFVSLERVLLRPLTPGAAGWIAKALLALASPPLLEA
jgi:ADP-ribose pyrophosphatase YjhB (NUDIX family)